MKNPFESGEIKNYLLLYAGVVVIMVLFFIATSLFFETKEVEKKEFATIANSDQSVKHKKHKEIKRTSSNIKLLDKSLAY
jgi:uncharacterized protein YacL